ncbi:M14 metallopeptidase family protein [Candidatus Poribacteria bacterium]
MSFDFYPDGKYNESIPTIEEVLGYSTGERITTYPDLERYLRRLEEPSDRLELHTYGETYEGRKLYYLVISSSENMAKLDQIKHNMALLADPRELKDESKAEAIVKETPAITWIACNVHGGEHSSGESALMTAYQLAAGEDDTTLSILKNSVVIIDPVQNPDGRERSINYFYSTFGISTNPDPNAAEHEVPWPGGRTNHYLFDLNRDWFPLTQVESRAKVKAFLEWNPQIYADLHEMGSNSTYFFPPPRIPVNTNIHKIIEDWWEIYGRGNADAFDRMGFEYYVREDFDSYYPGYGEAWPTFHGSVGMTYEEASARGVAIKREDKTVLTLRDASWHHFIASMSTCQTTAKHREKLLRDFYRFYRTAIEEGRDDVIKELLIVPDESSSDAEKLVRNLIHQGIEVRVAEEDFENPRVRNYADNRLNEGRFASGTYIVRMDQPKKRLIQTIFEKEAELSEEFIKEQIQRKKDRRNVQIYDTTAWSLPLAYGLDAYWTETLSDVPSNLVKKPARRGGVSGKAKVAYLLKYNSNGAIKCAFNMLQAKYKTHVAREPFKIRLASTGEMESYDRGTLVFKVNINGDDLHDRLNEIAEAEGVQIDPLDTQWVEEGINLGSNNVVYMKKPRIAVLYDQPAQSNAYGCLAYMLEQVYGIRFTAVRYGILNSSRIKDYNVIILPDGSSGEYNRLIGESGAKRLKSWASDGGTLVMIKGAAAFAARKGVDFTTSSLVRDLRKKDGESTEGSPPKDATKPEAKPEPVQIPQEFRPSHIPGAILRANLDQTHFLSYGYGEFVNVLMNSSSMFLPSRNGHNVATFADKENLRVSGLVWEDMLEALPGKAYLIDERVGQGHIILYADDPNFRAYWDGLDRLFFNSILFGPSLGR